MTMILADSFTAALAKLSNEEQKQAKLTAFDLQTDPDRPGLQMHRIDQSKDPNFWSVRVNKDIRIIIHKSGDSVMLAYVDHHDDAYKWAERRKIETHPRTGAVQIVEVRERVEQIVKPSVLPTQIDLPFAVQPPINPTKKPFASLSAEQVLQLGVPADWVNDVLAATEDEFFGLAVHLPQEASEALLEYAATGRFEVRTVETVEPLLHPDSQRRFRVLEGHDELAAALDQPFEKWAVFLHPSQRALVNRKYSGPARVVGSAGTGKTVVALHRVAYILKSDPASRVLLTTFSDPLAKSLHQKLSVLLADDTKQLDRVSVSSFTAAAAELYSLLTGRKPYLVDRAKVKALLRETVNRLENKRYTDQFLLSEWEHVIDAWQIDSLEAYAAVPRMGRKNRLGAKQREELWSIFSEVKGAIKSRAMLTAAMLFSTVAKEYERRSDKPYTHIVVDEAQDLGVAELRFLRAITVDTADGLFFAGDIGQRIFQQPFSWKGLGIDIRGRSFTLKVNYRTSHQIRKMADRLMPSNVRDADGEEDSRRGTVSIFEGLEPTVVIAPSIKDEVEAAAEYLKSAVTSGVRPAEVGVFCRSEVELPRVNAILEMAGLPSTSLTAAVGDKDAVYFGTMHSAKGLEFKVVLVVACDEGVLPLTSRVAEVADEFELDEVVGTERQLLYVAATRARDQLFVSGVAPGSEFLEEMTAA